MGKAVTIDINELIIGRELNLPIHAPSGVLLIGAGTTFTSDLKRRLLERGVHHIIVDEDEADRLTLNADNVDPEQLKALDQTVNSRVEEFIRNGMMQVCNSGPSVMHSVVKHGKKAYDAKQTAEIQQQQAKAASAISGLMSDADSCGEEQMNAVGELAGAGVGSLISELAGTLHSAFETGGNQSLAAHANSMATLGMALAMEMGFDFENVRKVGFAGMVADLGMTYVPHKIRMATGRLSPSEFVSIQKHVIFTANMLERFDSVPSVVRVAAYQVHERPDGSGYPRGRTLMSIHPFARVLNVADAYVAMTSPRPDRTAVLPYTAMEILLKQARQMKVDREVVRALLHVLSLFPIGSYVALSDGSVCRVIRSNGPQFTRPIVCRITDSEGKPVSPDSESAILDLTEESLEIVQALPPRGSKVSAHDLRAASELAAAV